MPGRYAVVIGINYRNFPPTMDQEAQSRAGINALNYAEADAVDMAAMLEADGYDVVKLVGPAASRNNIIDALRDQSRKAGPEGLLLVHYSGHGAIDPDDHELAYLLPADADPEEMASDAIPLDSVARYYLGRTQSALVILDCCHSGYAVGLKSGDKDVVLNSAAAEFSQQAGQTFKRVLGRVTIAACAWQQLARERADLQHGVLTYYLLKHWRESSEIVDDFSMYRYLAKWMPAHGVPAPVRGGTPQQGVIELRPARTVEVGDEAGSEEAVHTIEAELPSNPPPAVLPPSTPSTRTPTQQNQTISKGSEQPSVSRWIIPGSLVALIIIGLLGFLVFGTQRPPGDGVQVPATPLLPTSPPELATTPPSPPPPTTLPLPSSTATRTRPLIVLPTDLPALETPQLDWSGTWIKETPTQDPFVYQPPLVEGASKLVIGTNNQVKVFADARYTLDSPSVGSRLKSNCDMCLWGTAFLFEPTNDPSVVELRIDSPKELLHQLTLTRLLPDENRLSVVESLRLNSEIVEIIVYKYNFRRSP